MYLETVIRSKEQALVIVKNYPTFLFWRDSVGNPHNADTAKVESSWGIVEFFTCSYPTPRTGYEFDVRIIVGANAYAVINEGNRQTDILLSAGKSPQASLREYAIEQQAIATRALNMADLARRAADKLDSRA